MLFPEVTLRGPALPPRLADLAEPPDELHVRGELPRGPAVAIVGTRHPSDRARAFARELSSELAAAGVAVLSGGALGIDTEAHEGALDAGGCTVAITAAGFERPYPVQNVQLFQQIVATGGAYASLVAADVHAENWRFLVRNGVLAALAHIVVVVQAPIRSGARNAAAHARRLGRPLFVVPAAPWNGLGAGCAEELRLGALPLIKAEQIFAALEAARLHPIRRPRPGLGAVRKNRRVSRTWEGQLPLDPAARRLIEAIGDGAEGRDELCLQTGLPRPRVDELLLTLVHEGVLVADRTGRLKIT